MTFLPVRSAAEGGCRVAVDVASECACCDHRLRARRVLRSGVRNSGRRAGRDREGLRGGPGAVRTEARKRRVGAIDRDELRAEQWRRRAVRHWRADIGMVCGRFSLPPEVGVSFVNRLDAETDRVRREARGSGSTDSRDAHAPDAFMRMVNGEGAGASRTDLVLVCDLSAYRRGHSHEGEVSHMVGAGLYRCPRSGTSSRTRSSRSCCTTG